MTNQNGKPPPVPRVLNLRIERIIDEGGMGAVYLAWDENLHVHRAIKFIKYNSASDSAFRERFIRESRAAASIQSEHVVPVLVSGEEDGHLYYVMPIVQGTTLKKRIENRTLWEWTELRQLGTQLAEGLASIHEQNLVHRDLKPSNVMIEGDSFNLHATILDLGLAKAIGPSSSLTMDGVQVGTLAYMSPEQIRAESLDARSDLFSLGTILYEVATGVHPFNLPNVTISEGIQRITPTNPSDLNKKLPLAISGIVMRMLEKERKHRPASAIEVVNLFSTFSVTPDSAEDLLRCQMAVTPNPRNTKATNNTPVRHWQWIKRGLIAAVPLAVLVLSIWIAKNQEEHLPLTAIKGHLEVKIDAVRDDYSGWLNLEDPAALPIKADDGYIATASLERPAYAYLLLIKPDGTIKPIYPWFSPGEWETLPQRQNLLGREKPFVFEPEPGKSWKIPKGNPGMLTLLMLARETPLSRSDKLEELIGKLPAQKPRTYRAKAWYENGVLQSHRPNRDADFEANKDVDPQSILQRRIRDELVGPGKPFAYSLSVTFATEGR